MGTPKKSVKKVQLKGLEFARPTSEELGTVEKKYARFVKANDFNVDLPSTDSLVAGFLDRIEVCYVDDDPFTTCLLKMKGGAVVAVGTSKRATYVPMADMQKPERGKEIALTRAVKGLLHVEGAVAVLSESCEKKLKSA